MVERILAVRKAPPAREEDEAKKYHASSGKEEQHLESPMKRRRCEPVGNAETRGDVSCDGDALEAVSTDEKDEAKMHRESLEKGSARNLREVCGELAVPRLLARSCHWLR